MPVFSGVMFGQHGDHRAAGFRPCAHLDGCRVEIRHGRAVLRRTHVEPQGEHQRFQTGVVTPKDYNLKFVLI
jgi:hypothetical protein